MRKIVFQRVFVRRCSLIVIAASACVSSACAPVDLASHPRTVQPERPTVATHASTVAPAYVEVETGYEHDRYPDKSNGNLIPTVIKFGVTPRVQLSISVPLQNADGISFALGDVAAGFKINVLNEHPWLGDIAILPQVKFSTGGDRGTGTTDGSLLLINSHSFGSVDIDLNAGITRRSGDGTDAPQTSTLFAVSSGLPVYRNLGFALECFGYPGTSGPAGSAPTVAMLFGPTYLLRPELAFDVGVIAPVSGGQPRAVYAGLVANFGRLPLPVRRASSH